ncbi:actin-like ATPase domain-containing protein [Ascoidea rubescens DSM 1968]|uniref:Actin-like ATPase domain-containing protein n=1 Tax=Ascoidea rubescens DSM 1968 TaxID=1344418 RepID=A0A1D2VE93_9ASCO|nr:actin-like ATPase domain-containing protein [Ascoidea rubescens DSM 1968]ODV59971.1 actin-like ATPase domain-containing protein [Ascoidea rubescens DSM 1968]
MSDQSLSTHPNPKKHNRNSFSVSSTAHTHSKSSSSTQKQYHAAILQIGSRFIRAGFAGDTFPISTVLTNETRWKYRIPKQIKKNSTSCNDLYYLNHCLPPSVSRNDNSGESDSIDDKLTLQYTKDILSKQYLFSYDSTFGSIEGIDENSLCENIVLKILSKIYQEDLLVDPSSCKIIIIEPPLFPLHLKKIISNVLLKKLFAKSLLFICEPALSCLGSGTRNALVVDLGWENITVSPVYDMRLIYKNIQTSTRAGKFLHYTILKRFLSEKVIKKKSGFKSTSKLFNIIEEFVFQAVYCRTVDESVRERIHSEENNFRLISKENSNDFLDIPDKLRFESVEHTLFPSSAELDNPDDDEFSVVDLILKVIEKVPIDLRRELSDNIIFTGGLSNIPGVKARTLQELRKKKPNAKFSANFSLGPWSGASLYCKTKLVSAPGSLVKSHELLRDKYIIENETIQIPDWLDQIHQNTFKSAS